MKFLVLILLFVLFACADGIERLEKPDDLIPRDKMVLVLKELLKVEGHITDEYISVNRFYKIMKESGDAVLKENGVSKEQLEGSFNYYGSRQDEIQSIYDDVLEELNAELWELQSDKNK